MTFNTESRGSQTATSTGITTHTRYSTSRRGLLVRALVRVSSLWQAIQAGLVTAWTWVRETVTAAGALAILALLALPIGISLGWTELIVAGALAAALLLLALPFLLGGKAYSVQFQVPVERVVAGGEVHGTLDVSNVSKSFELPGRVDVPIGSGTTEIAVPLLRPGAHHAEVVVIPTPRRGIIDVGPVTTLRTDPIGLLRREHAQAEVHRLFVHPVTVSIPSTSAGFVRDLEGNPTNRIVDADMSFHAIREYAAGDAQRSIHWKSTAKTGQLMVRQYEESRRSRLVVVLSLATTDFNSDEEFEIAVSAAGSLGTRAIRDGRDLAVVASEQIQELARSSVHSIRSLPVLSTRALLDELSGIEKASATMPIEDVCALTGQAIPDVSIAIVVCGSAVTATRLRSLTLRFGPDVAVLTVRIDPLAVPSYRELAGVGVLTIAVLDDLRSLLARRAS
ncbi:DUF58 domain-containing protein [Microterricola viridarii]|uniref:DUF58 domain-containing protein n=1 Tax=Microterricola viridarii TaxID=412690 RepID=A0A1H1PUT2_9MICO|nr:DUF58 domain-containing protein [Microterricola viridarii]SDS14948.1 Protein of unknown function DUF58 [Microterricola viridarii]